MLSSDPQSFVLGAWLEDELIGMIGLGREHAKKLLTKPQFGDFMSNQTLKVKVSGKLY